MKIGLLRHPIEILAPSANRDAYGENRQTWTSILNTRAGIQQLRGSLLTLAQARDATALATHLITIRWNARVKETYRVQSGASLAPDFDGLSSMAFAQLASAPTPTATSPFGAMGSQASGNPPLIYTITSILDPDTRYTIMNLLCTVAKA